MIHIYNYLCFHINDGLEISTNSTFPFLHLILPSPFFCPKNLYPTSKFCPNSSVRLCLLPLHPTPGQYSYQGKISKFYRFLKLLNCAASGTAAVRHLVGSAGVYCWNWCCEGVQVRHYCDTLSVRESSSASTICTCAKVCQISGTDGAIWAGTPHTPLTPNPGCQAAAKGKHSRVPFFCTLQFCVCAVGD